VGLEVALLQRNELPELYRFRHDVFFGELRAHLSNEEVVRGYMVDALDEVAFNYALRDGPNIVGSLRTVDLERVPSLAELEKKYSLMPILDRFSADAACQVGRLAIAPQCRSGVALTKLIKKAYEDCVRLRRRKVVVSDCSPYLLPVWEALGYRCYGPAFNDPIYGLKLPILLLLEDVAHLKAVHSPFAAVAAKIGVKADDSVRSWFSNTYPQFSSNSSGSTASTHGLPEKWLEQHSLFLGLGPEEVHSLLRDEVIVEVRPRDYLILRGLKEEHLYFVLEGTVEAVDEAGNVLAQFGKGDFVGEMAFLTGAVRTADVVVREPAKCILITARTFSKLDAAQPALYGKVMRNIARTLAVRLQATGVRSRSEV
jgi:hypothetical protein